MIFEAVIGVALARPWARFAERAARVGFASVDALLSRLHEQTLGAKRRLHALCPAWCPLPFCDSSIPGRIRPTFTHLRAHARNHHQPLVDPDPDPDKLAHPWAQTCHPRPQGEALSVSSVTHGGGCSPASVSVVAQRRGRLLLRYAGWG